MAETTADPFSALISDIASRVEAARAKINLALHVLGRRADGFHLIDSLVVFAEVGDTLTAAPLDGGAVDFAVDGQFADHLATTPVRDNLVLRAAEQLMKAHPAKTNKGVGLKLTKRLPIAAGLGGGSADAAAALRLLNRYWELKLAPAQLAELGLRIGSDVPICLASRPLHAEGIGEKVKPLPGIPALPVVLINPGIEMATRKVFRRLHHEERTPMWPLPKGFPTIMEFVHWLRMTRNDLFEPAKLEAKVVGAVVKALGADPECLLARMSGSGATAFGIFNTSAAATRAADRLRAKHPKWWVAVTKTGGS
jgi:4-diphosphocytidyl-2-C-methyl-D-erythritol kinase